MEETLDWYMEIIRKEVKQCIDGRLNGSVGFQFNLRDGGIGNMTCDLGKSFKKPQGGVNG